MTKYYILVLSLLVLGSCGQSSNEVPVEDVGGGEGTAQVSPPEGVVFAFPEQFGRSFIFVAQVVEKDNSYYDQNLMKASFRLRVLSVEGIELETPISIEPFFFEAVPEQLVIGATLELNGYERLQQVGAPYITGEHTPQIRLHYVSQLVILP